VNVRRCLFPTTPSSSQRHLCARSLSRPGRGAGVYPEPLGALSSSDLFLSSLNFRPSTFNCSSSTPFLATLTNHSQPIENAITLSPVFASLTDTVKHKSFACRSYKKHRGVGYTAQSKFFSPPHASLNHSSFATIPFRITSFAHPHPLTPIESYSCKKHRGGGLLQKINSQFRQQRPGSWPNAIPSRRVCHTSAAA